MYKFVSLENVVLYGKKYVDHIFHIESFRMYNVENNAQT